MDLQLFSIENCPRRLPAWELICNDLGRPPVPRIARALGVGASTVYRWHQMEDAPRMACLALFWLTRWGRSEIDTRATNDAMTAVALARALDEDRQALRRQVLELDAERHELASRLERLRQMVDATAADRGSGATAGRSHTGMAPWGSSAPGWSVGWQLMPQPLSVPPAAPPAPAQAPSAGPDSPAAPPPSARSARSPGRRRTPPPPPSAPQEAVSSSPCESLHHHSDATLTPQQHHASDGF